MNQSEVELLSRAHDMFAGGTRRPPLDPGTAHHHAVLRRAAGLNDGLARGGYRLAAEHSRQRLAAAAGTDAAMADVIAGADRDRAQARELTRNVLDEARAEPAVVPATPMAQREAMRRRAARLRAQHAHVVSARLRARRRLAELRALRYQLWRRRAAGAGPTGRAAIAVRAALSRLGRPYVWGATGPDQFDCSGLVQWSYAQAGIHLDRTTYQQINDGIPVPRSQIRPGDLVFPHAGHVQLAIGNNLVVEAPYSGASVRISPLGPNVAIRRPL
ncbi:hypothetical protein BRW65_23890 [Mycobacterium paraffinicum]|uniref:NlpC/P60 domain-containing protein n=1 Tax=Mycobacterium paraffinicum TaxID=53378 RepID=A0A1Q4HNP1_9MYCO|nr:C40 family peptidase [Mycobacterium paraffinicum]OJZ69062.1 hypothetical protein BRW65_23890 [Mycobacterium paraffinicum]